MHVASAMHKRQQVTGLVCSLEEITGLPAARAQKFCFRANVQPGSGAGGGGGDGGRGGGAGPGGGDGPGGLNGLCPSAKKGTASPCNARFESAPIFNQLSTIVLQLSSVSPFQLGSALVPIPSGFHAEAHFPAAAIMSSARSNAACASVAYRATTAGLSRNTSPGGSPQQQSK